MSVPGNLLGQVDSASALRCGFANLQPISVKRTIQKWGLKLTTVSWQIRSERWNDFIEDYPAYATFLTDSVAKRVKFPQKIDPHALTQVITKTMIDEFNKDKELKSALKKVEKEKDSGKPFLEFVRFLRKRYDKEREGTIQANAEMFTCSNLPFSFFTNLVMSNEIYQGFLDVLHKKINLYESVWLYKFRDDPTRFQKKFQEMKQSLVPLFDAMELVSFTKRCLSTLVSAYNCDDAESLFSIEFMDIKKVDYAQFEQLSAEFCANLENCTSTILRMEPNSFSELPRTDLTNVFSQVLV